jgi:predicted hotdog family 3-hydroxylacyl-ACP dehydratase
MTNQDFNKALKQLCGSPATDFVLHREPMLFVDRLVDIDSESVTCEWRVSGDSEFAAAGLGVPGYTGIEFMAQCVAVHSRECARVCQELVRDAQGMGSFSCRIESEGTCVAEARLAVFETPEETSSNEQ